MWVGIWSDEGDQRGLQVPVAKQEDSNRWAVSGLKARPRKAWGFSPTAGLICFRPLSRERDQHRLEETVLCAVGLSAHSSSRIERAGLGEFPALAPDFVEEGGSGIGDVEGVHGVSLRDGGAFVAGAEVQYADGSYGGRAA